MKSIIILGAGIMQIKAIKTAKDLGLYVIAADRDSEAVGFKHADLKLVIDTKDTKSLVDFALNNKNTYNIKGVFAAADNAITAAAINEALGLIGVSSFSAKSSNNKWLSKQLWLSSSVPTPYAKEVKTLKDAKKAIEKVGLPCMVKAIDSSASRGTQKLESISNLEIALEEAFRYSSAKSALIEEYVEGFEYSAETVIYNSKQYRFGIAKREYDLLPLPIETGHVNPADLDSKTQEEMYKIVYDAALALKIDNAPAKADMIIRKSDSKIMILEMAARLSGGFHSQYTTPLSSGMDPIKFVMQLTLGEEPYIDTYTPKMNKVALCRAIFPKPGYVEKIEGIEEALKIKGINKIFLTIKEGDVIEDYKHCAHRVCYVIASGDSYKEADSAFKLAKNIINFKIRSNNAT
ncbi:MAG TPA: ATP-grasp domain-containing protein [Desulfurella acetivorans]|uniref:ATP-grasp domain-containing protein n=1 Tax=Desulfurella acetivorans TaxID=33002 RepID=A0A7C6A6A8_DESAE|nr:ATP-grasp domain-containing protein [Desulfurella acetivorans]